MNNVGAALGSNFCPQFPKLTHTFQKLSNFKFDDNPADKILSNPAILFRLGYHQSPLGLAN